MARSRLQGNWNWFDEITPNLILGALPFTLEELQATGVQAVVTLNEDFEVFITTDMYQDAGMAHLHIPTVDFLFAPPTEDLHRGVDFIRDNAGEGRTTYVHCKAGRGRSTTLVLCYLIKYKGMTPEEAYAFVRLRRPQVCLAQGQWTAVCTFHVSCHPGKDLPPVDRPVPPYLPVSTLPAVEQTASNPDSCGSTTSTEGSDEAGRKDACETRAPNPAGIKSPPGEEVSKSAQPADAEEIVMVEDLPAEKQPEADSVTAAAVLLEACCLSPMPDIITEEEQPTLRSAAASQASSTEPAQANGHSFADAQEKATREQSLSVPGIELESPVPSGANDGLESSKAPQTSRKGRQRHQEIVRGRPQERKPLGHMSSPAGEMRSVALSTERSGSLPLASLPGPPGLLKEDDDTPLIAERSGSLPGYVRVQRAGERQRSEPADLQPMQATLAAAGFNKIEDWAAVKRCR